ncbi:MAG: hypothetical protein A2092_06380 [Rhodobacteraceae bacterium GWE1_64_9]|nr:DUF883 domain-containing protein [Gemmobacter sp.]OHC44178.1 MAG: hypothetical protein A2092_06380 [Rhodobacteraceae bacterium GWE1_64_9]HBU15920.1 DUF883 domain-containing protein [Gemmobacter sp.]
MPTRREDTADLLETQVAELKADLARLAALLADRGQTEAETLRDTARAEAEKLRAKGAEGVAQAEDWLRGHPGQALGIAAGLGFLLGLLLGRR